MRLLYIKKKEEKTQKRESVIPRKDEHDQFLSPAPAILSLVQIDGSNVTASRYRQ